MRNHIKKAKLLFLLFFFLLNIGVSERAYFAYADELRLQVVSPMKRIFLDSFVNGQDSQNIELWAARNEYESAQIAIHSDNTIAIRGVEAEDLKAMGSGSILSSTNFTYKFSNFVFVESHTSRTPDSELEGKAPGWFPDPFEEDKEINFTGTRALWLTWYVPENAEPGDYIGNILIHTDADTRTVPLKLRIWHFTLPQNPSLYMTNWLSLPQIESSYGVKHGTDAFWQIIDLIAEDMHEHRQNVIFTPLNLIRTTRFANGDVQFNFSNYEKWVEIFRKNGFQLFEGSHLFHSKNSFDIRIYDDCGIQSKSVDFGEEQLSTKEGQEYLEALLKALNQVNIRIGINANYVQHIADEAPLEKVPLYRQIASIVHSVMPGIPIIDATQLNSTERMGMMDKPVLLIGKPITMTTVESNMQQWWYTCIVPRGRYPNRFIDYPLVKLRIIPWLSWRYGITGYLHYGYNWWYTKSGKSPWEDVSQAGAYPAGDGFIVYPPTKNLSRAPVSSLRWETLRDAMEDYEYLIMLIKLKNNIIDGLTSETNNDKKLPKTLSELNALISDIQKVVIDPEQYPRDYRILLDFRYRIGSLMDSIAQ